MSNHDLEYWFWLCLFVSGAFYMVIDVSRRVTDWLLRRVLPARHVIIIEDGDKRNRVSVRAYSLDRAVIKAIAKYDYQYLLERLHWSPSPWRHAFAMNLKWLFRGEWLQRRKCREYDQGMVDAMAESAIEFYAYSYNNHWANRRGLYLLCLRAAELKADNLKN